MNDRPWLVLMASNPKKAEFCFSFKNMEEKKAGRPEPFNFFIPYTDMTVTETKGAERKNDLLLRSALHRYVFVQGSESMTDDLIHEWNSNSNERIYFLRNERKIAKISCSDMKRLMDACSNDDVVFNPEKPVRELKVGDEFSLANTPFEKKDTIYTVLDIRKKRFGIYEIQVQMKLFGVSFKNVWVTYMEEGEAEDGRDVASLISSTQKKLLDIFKRRVKNQKEESGRLQLDTDTLQSIYDLRDIPLRPGTRKRRWQALMLICSHLMGNHEGKKRFLSEVKEELDEIGKLRESKAATDTRAYLHIAVYIATGNPMYRDLAKAYVRKYTPTSVSLCQFVSTMSKHAASKVIGHSKKRKKNRHSNNNRNKEEKKELASVK